MLFPAAGRKVGRGALESLPGWTADDAARALLLDALPLPRAQAVADAYADGDNAEKRAVLRALPILGLGDEGLPLVRDALRTNDTRLVAAAMSPTPPPTSTTRAGGTACSSACSSASPWPRSRISPTARTPSSPACWPTSPKSAKAVGRVVPDDVHLVLNLVDQES